MAPNAAKLSSSLAATWPQMQENMLLQYLILATIIITLALATDRIEAQGAWFAHIQTGMEVGPTGAQFGHSDPADAR
jgi:hypothetical protein